MIHPPDYHIHSYNSVDSTAQLSAICEAATSRGLTEIAITDHADFGPDDQPGYFHPVEYLAAIKRCRAHFDDRLTIRAGVEMGEPHIFGQQLEDILAAGEFDFVIGSAHYAVGMQAGWKPAFFEQPLRQAYEAYFQQVVRLAKEGDFDVLGHLDLIKRDAFKFGQPYDGPEPYADLIRTALRAVVERGKGIEINTSPLRKGLSEPCPSLDILRWYRELGGEILTFGSDAHTANDVGADFDVAIEMARTAEFTRVARFEKRALLWTNIN